MFKFISKKLKKNNKGFTLVELIAVLAILGIIGAIAVPRFAATRKNAAITAHNANVKTLMNAASVYYVEKGIGTEWLGDVKDSDQSWKNYLQDWPEVPKNVVGMAYLDDEGKKITIGDKEGYVVNIDDDGTITVTPGLIGEEQPEEEQPENETNE